LEAFFLAVRLFLPTKAEFSPPKLAKAYDDLHVSLCTLFIEILVHEDPSLRLARPIASSS
jgi:hypothetical protein